MNNIPYGFPDPSIIPCPFCDKEISVLFIPSARAPKKASWGGRAAMVKTRSEEYLVQKGCSNCSKSAEEIQKELNKEASERNKYAGGAFQRYSFKRGILKR